tara:strand:+ start:38640 stop:40430 length:1791 start_codon:yes stop_codon:yes gene_type:complete
MSVLETLTEGIVNRDVQKEGAALLDKWSNTGLLEGIGNDIARNNMARLLENQAAQLLKESSAMSAGDVEGFAAVAFPIVRRVFGGLIANDLVSVQPMSLPSGLIFFMDFTYSDDTTQRLSYEQGDSIYGGGVVGQALTGGVNLTGESGEDSFYNLNNGFSSPTGSTLFAGAGYVVVASGTVGNPAGTVPHPLSLADQAKLDKMASHDPDLSGSVVVVCEITGATGLAQLNVENLIALNITPGGGQLIRRTTQLSSGSVGDYAPGNAGWKATFLVEATGSQTMHGTTAAQINNLVGNVTGSLADAATFPITDNFGGTPTADGLALGAVVGTTTWGLENEVGIPEIDIKVDSVSVTAMTKKLKAKWTPELGQDLNAYHNLDAEVELTSVLSEHIALEIDREILEDLVKGSTAGTLYWSRRPGKFVNRETGAGISSSANEELLGADFTGTVSEWYETLIETINDVSARIHRKTLRGGANFVVVSPEVANLMEFTSGFRASVTHDEDRGTAGAVRVGSLSKKFDVYVDPYFPRNVVLVGRKGSSFLESGYVYAPYVPLQVTPTIFGTEDFVPRKGVMTRYAKKMVRPDMYGLVIVEDLIG